MDIGLVCDSCDGFSDFGVSKCSKCGQPLSLSNASSAPSQAFAAEPEPTQPQAPPPQAPPSAPAQSGGGAGRQTMFFGAMQAARAKLVVIRGDGLDGVSFTLAGSEHIAGRTDCPVLFEDDEFLSPQHANFLYIGSQLVVADLDSTNGIYIRLKGSQALKSGGQLLVGQQHLRVKQLPIMPPAAQPDGTYFYATPSAPGGFQVQQLLHGGKVGAMHVFADSCSLGRESNSINYPDDPFISGKHALIELKDDKLTLTDLDSRNGTFLRIEGQQPLNHGDYLFMGQQLLRVEIV